MRARQSACAFIPDGLNIPCVAKPSLRASLSKGQAAHRRRGSSADALEARTAIKNMHVVKLRSDPRLLSVAVAVSQTLAALTSPPSLQQLKRKQLRLGGKKWLSFSSTGFPAAGRWGSAGYLR